MKSEQLRWLADRRAYTSHAALLLLAVVAVVLITGRTQGESAGLGMVREESASYLTTPVVFSQYGGGVGAVPNLGREEAVAVPTAPEESAVPVAFREHTVAEGETLNMIAGQYGVSAQYLIWNNPGLSADPNLLLIGEKLLVPGIEGIVYDVRLGDNVNDIALTYGVDPSAVIGFGPNNLSSPDLIVEGMVLVLPGAVPPPPPVIEVTEAEAEPEAPAADPDTGFMPELPVAVAAVEEEPVGGAPAAISAPVASVGYIWPVGGPLWSGFGSRWGSFHKGIDIGAAYGTAVAAAGSGQVVLATYRDNGYGNYVIVRHADGSETLYAHLSALYVSLGQYVNQGDVVGAVGCTGWCSGNHLHFEVYIGGSPVNPLNYLP